MQQVILFTSAVSLVSVSAAALAHPAPKDKNPAIEAIRKHLGQRYPAKIARVAGELHFGPDTKVTEFATPAIRQADSTLRLYRTSLSTGHFEYPDVEVAVAAWMDGGVLKTVECLSPVYTDESASFIGRLRGLRAKTMKEREKLASEICQLFSGITYRGRIVDGRLANNEYSAELWHHQTRWRTIRIAFDQDGTITLVKLENTCHE